MFQKDIERFEEGVNKIVQQQILSQFDLNTVLVY